MTPGKFERDLAKEIDKAYALATGLPLGVYVPGKPITLWVPSLSSWQTVTFGKYDKSIYPGVPPKGAGPNHTLPRRNP